MDIDLKYLKTFYTICETNGFTNASKALHLTQPAVSYHIRMLEDQFKVRLIERVGKKIVLNDFGKTLYAFCKHFFDELDEIRSDFLMKECVPKKMLKICSVSGFGRYVLFPALSKLKSERLRFDLRFRESHEIFSMVLNGECDLGITAEFKTSNHLNFEEIYEEEFVMICSPNFHGKINYKDLPEYQNIPMITYEEGDFVFGKWFEANFGKQPNLLSIAGHFDELEEVIETVKSGAGISIVPNHCVSGDIKSKKLKVTRPFKTVKVKNKIYGVTLTGTYEKSEISNILVLLKKPNP